MNSKERKALADWGVAASAVHEGLAAGHFKNVSNATDINKAFTISQSDVIALVAPYKASWAPTLCGVLQRVYGLLATDALRTSFTLACLRNTNSSPAVTPAWREAITFLGATPAETLAMLEPGSAHLKAVPDLWSRFLKTGNASQLADFVVTKWPEGQREALAAMLVADPTQLAAYVTKYRAVLEATLTAADMASASWRGFAASLVRMKSDKLPWPVIDALLKADTGFVTELNGYVGVDASSGQAEFRKWLMGRAPRPFSAEVASIFNAYVDHFDQAEARASAAAAAATTPEEKQKAEGEQATARDHMEISIEQRHGLQIAGAGEHVPVGDKKSEAFSAAALRRTAVALRSLPGKMSRQCRWTGSSGARLRPVPKP